MMNKKPLFAVGAVLTMTLAVWGAVILPGHPNRVYAANTGMASGTTFSRSSKAGASIVTNQAAKAMRKVALI